MVTRLLQAAGMHLGEPADMMKPQPDNEEGYYENLRFFRINERDRKSTRLNSSHT